MFLGRFGLPGRDFSFQNRLKARRCHPIKVSGLTITKADFQSSQSLDQKTRLRPAASSTDRAGYDALGRKPTAYVKGGSLRSEMSGIEPRKPPTRSAPNRFPSRQE